MSTLLKINQIQHCYGNHKTFDDLSFDLQKGEIGCLLGPSGCGKTTVLRCIAGFESLTAGQISLNGVAVSDSHFSLPPEQRRIGMVFQDYALFPHLTVAENIGFGLHRSPTQERKQRVIDMLKTIGLIEAADRYPHELSGGQQQRVALARALAPRPDLLLLDEPFSNLDITLRERLSQEVREILKNQQITAILVTHDQGEAFSVADMIGVMHQGKIMQWDTAYNLYHRPANRFVANFIGQGVFLPGKVLDLGMIEMELGVLSKDIYHHCESDQEICPIGSEVEILIRPDDIVYCPESSTQALITHKAFRGAEILYTLKLASGMTVLSLIPSHHDHAIGEKLGIRLEADHVVIFSKALLTYHSNSQFSAWSE
ncbi:MAG TPA: ABC transporter ATP-binding protein [Nitrosomonas nitrosa]|uniref:Iron(III) transport system ATP-binding protein n=1 Tax=Nitrosomonas nitrosa TaxID=52442 RepID=A0A1I4SXJ7_9PROT|nr:ABC transporter ATP-binding protein [Nitrosomonas nitrosa]PTQ91704.1 iron(III) transport system ATP-binding protein [Nitrosomonas nitrosa]SFM69182.1 iron(III) transport system ATP-binding protein [Nitrosomonas nitrosa]HBZ30606.1 ABC transporter ATP-binding protein [Nitrosomonas nitrosa]HNP52375.1 ABC transporter ATP-binding protein [Nitrosomonas nitrosa]